MSQYINLKNETRRHLTKKGARAFVPGSENGDVSVLRYSEDIEEKDRGNVPSIESHRFAYGHRHGRGDDWAAENAREHGRITSGKLRDADRAMLQDGATRAGVTVEEFTAAVLGSDPHTTLPPDFEGTRAPADRIAPVASTPKPTAKGRKNRK